MMMMMMTEIYFINYICVSVCSQPKSTINNDKENL
jgi:hypothetical protein